MDNDKYQVISHIDRDRQLIDIMVKKRSNPEIWVEKIAPLNETNSDNVYNTLIDLYILCIDELEKNEHNYDAFLDGMEQAKKLLLHKKELENG